MDVHAALPVRQCVEKEMEQMTNVTIFTIEHVAKQYASMLDASNPSHAEFVSAVGAAARNMAHSQGFMRGPDWLAGEYKQLLKSKCPFDPAVVEAMLPDTSPVFRDALTGDVFARELCYCWVVTKAGRVSAAT
jgi:hypothetical protein